MLHRDKTSRLTIAFTLCALVACGPVRADDWNVGLKRLSLPGPVNGAAMVGIVTYPTTALTSSLTVGRFRLVAAEDARPATGKFPLVIFSHGTGSQPELYLWLFEGLTAKGFVVAGLAHPKDN